MGALFSFAPELCSTAVAGVVVCACSAWLRLRQPEPAEPLLPCPAQCQLISTLAFTQHIIIWRKKGLKADGHAMPARVNHLCAALMEHSAVAHWMVQLLHSLAAAQKFLQVRLAWLCGSGELAKALCKDLPYLLGNDG